MTYLTVPIVAPNPDTAKQQIKAAIAPGAQMLELRTDYLENLTPALVKELIASVRTTAGQQMPIIVTCRDKHQGGAIPYQPDLRVDVLTAALDVGAEFIDFEYENFLSSEHRQNLLSALSQNPKARLILSAHDFSTKFPDITRLYHSILDICPAAIPKLVYTANCINDCFEAFDLSHNTSGERIIFCMGQAGLISRIIAKKLGTLVTFASIDQETATAPGQLTIRQFREIYRYDRIKSDTQLYGVIGFPIAHSLSPPIHNACFAEAGLNKLYLPLLVEEGKSRFARFMDNVLVRDWLDFRGLSVTIPHKQNALDYVRQNRGSVEPLAEKIGAVNTLLIGADGKLGAYNTDYAGALDAITSALKITRDDFNGLDVAVIGAGGVARAIVAGLSDAGAKIKIYNRTVKKAEHLAAEFNCSCAPLDDIKNIESKLLINCTSIGMQPNTDSTPLPKECIKKNMTVFDTVYNPAETLLLEHAKQVGAKTIDGLSMFVNQARSQYEFFTAQAANTQLMRETICDCLGLEETV